MSTGKIQSITFFLILFLLNSTTVLGLVPAKFNIDAQPFFSCKLRMEQPKEPASSAEIVPAKFNIDAQPFSPRKLRMEQPEDLASSAEIVYWQAEERPLLLSSNVWQSPIEMFPPAPYWQSQIGMFPPAPYWQGPIGMFPPAPYWQGPIGMFPPAPYWQGPIEMFPPAPYWQSPAKLIYSIDYWQKHLNSKMEGEPERILATVLEQCVPQLVERMVENVRLIRSQAEFRRKPNQSNISIEAGWSNYMNFNTASFISTKPPKKFVRMLLRCVDFSRKLQKGNSRGADLVRFYLPLKKTPPLRACVRNRWGIIRGFCPKEVIVMITEREGGSSFDIMPSMWDPEIGSWLPEVAPEILDLNAKLKRHSTGTDSLPVKKKKCSPFLSTRRRVH